MRHPSGVRLPAPTLRHVQLWPDINLAPVRTTTLRPLDSNPSFAWTSTLRLTHFRRDILGHRICTRAWSRPAGTTDVWLTPTNAATDIDVAWH